MKVIIGTTGYSEKQKTKIAEIAKEIAIVLAPNMSVGVNLSLKLLEMTAKNYSSCGLSWDADMMKAIF